MASWTSRCSGSSNEELVSNLWTSKIITNPNIFSSMLQTDRAKYLPELDNQKSSRYKYGPYADAPQSIGHKVTISAPYIHAIELEILIEHIERENSKILDVGCGSGILLGYMGRLAPNSSTIVGIDIVEELVNLTVSNLNSDGFSVDTCSKCSVESQPAAKDKHTVVSQVNQCRILVVHGNGWLGAPDIGPFDAINVGAGASKVPLELIQQLKYDGILLIPIGDKIQSAQTLTKYVKRRSSDDSGWHLEEIGIRTVRFVPLVAMPESNSQPFPVNANYKCLDGINWDMRYQKGWAYGNEPNLFLVDAIRRFSLESLSRSDAGNVRCLSLGEGQGRNSVYLSTLGFHCTALDSSRVGLAKAQRLAKQRNVSHRHCEIAADITEYDLGLDHYDVIVSIFFMLPPDERRKIHQKCVDALKDGGIVIIQCFSPRQLEIRSQQQPDAKWTLGPSEECLVGWEDLLNDFQGFELLHGQEKEVDLREGGFHRGRAVLTEFAAKKYSLSQAGENDALRKKDRFCIAMDEIFDSYDVADRADLSCPSPSYTGQPAPLDRLLQYADRTLQMSCAEAQKSSWCRYCWSSAATCFCAEIEEKLSGIVHVTGTSHDDDDHSISLHWVMVVHPNEFLRSTSTVKIASRFLERLEGSSCEVLVYGFHKHQRRLDKILLSITAESAAGRNHKTILLFPEAQAAEDKSFPDGCITQTGISQLDVEMVSTTPSTVERQTFTDPPPSKGRRSKMTIIVPDGTWENARAIVAEIRRVVSQDQLPSFSLNPEVVGRHFSPLIETLKEGQGVGRITTLEACALLLNEILEQPSQLCDALLASLSVLVEYVKGTVENSLDEKSWSKSDEHFKMWTAEIQAGAQELPVAMTATPIGLRRCPLCCEYLATPQRMQQHIRGRRHCSVVAYRFCYSSCDADAASPLRYSSLPDRTVARDVFQKFSTDSMRAAIAEPPDIAVTMLKLAIEAKADGTERHSKGERALQTATVPQVAAELPRCLRRRAELFFDTKLPQYDFYGVVTRLLQSAPSIGRFRKPSVSGEPQQVSLEDYIPAKDLFRNFKARQVLYNTVSNDVDLLAMYERLVIEVCCPFLKSSLQQQQEVAFYYQYPPTLRLQSGPSEEHGRPHRDLEYGHQVGEVNFWMPLTDYEKTMTTLWAESSPGAADFGPLAINYGQVAVFHGSLCQHYAPMNSTGHTRVSLDFRIGVGDYFDPNWELPSARGKHPRRKYRL
jgi:protein-L-isoaspartate(D-aspartate) O-methyltransferase